MAFGMRMIISIVIVVTVLFNNMSVLRGGAGVDCEMISSLTGQPGRRY
jgi:hypothetical protein